MSRFKELIIKEFRVQRKALFIPFWIMAVVYFVVLFFSLLSFIQSGFTVQVIEVDVSSYINEIEIFNAPFQYLINLLLIIFPGILLLFNIFGVSSEAINGDNRRGCEVFYRTMPVSIWQAVGSKILVALMGSWIVTFVIVLVNILIINSAVFFSLGEILTLSPVSIFRALVHGLLSFYLISMLLCSLTFFFSSVFKENPIVKGFGFLITLDLLIFILDRFFSVSLSRIPSFSYLISNIVLTLTGIFSKIFSDLDVCGTEVTLPGLSVFFSFNNLYIILISLFLFLVATLIYSKREIL